MDTFNLSKPKRNISRDFSDGYLVAEILHLYYPHLIQLHNYYNTNNRKTKESNWDLLKRKAFKKIQFFPSETLITDVIDCKYLAIETFLITLHEAVSNADIKKPVIKVFQGSNEHLPGPAKPKEVDRKKFIDVHEKESHAGEAVKELKETVEILEAKINKLNQVINIKDEKIRILEKRLFENGLR